MFCQHCGKESPDSAAFCNQCGAPLALRAAEGPAQAAAPAGFSMKIGDPAFKSYQKKSSIWSFLFAAILAVIAVIAFPIYGSRSGEIDWPYSLYYGMGIGGMFLVIALLQFLKRNLEKTWDGTVASKDVYRERNRNNDQFVSYDTVYRMKVRKDSGGTKTHKWRNTPGLYDYYAVGDRVRHHKGFYYYEKYDKSRDAQILCAACMTLNDISRDTCSRCKCPLLK